MFIRKIILERINSSIKLFDTSLDSSEFLIGSIEADLAHTEILLIRGFAETARAQRLFLNCSLPLNISK